MWKIGEMRGKIDICRYIDREGESEKQTESVCERVQTEREKKKERDTIEK